MIFKEKEYKLLVEALKEANPQFRDSDLTSFINSDYKTEKIDNVEEIIKTENYAKLPPTNSGFREIKFKDAKGQAQVQYHLSDWLYNLDKKIFKIVQNKFFQNGIDLCMDMQEELLKREDVRMPYEGYMSDRYMGQSYQYAYYQLNDKTNYKSSPEAEKVFNDVLGVFVKSFRKNDHVIALGFIKKAIEAKEDKNKVLAWFKTFITINKTISPTSKKHMDWIKSEIKDWDLTKHLKNNEINLLYSSEDGFISKKVEGLFYEIDLNLVKVKTKATSDTIGTNLRVLIATIDEVLGNTSNYIKTTSSFNDPQMQFNILFQSGVENNQIEAMNNIVKEIVNSKEKITQKEMSQLISTGLLAAFLEEKLEEKTQPQSRKAKI